MWRDRYGCRHKHRLCIRGRRRLPLLRASGGTFADLRGGPSSRACRRVGRTGNAKYSSSTKASMRLTVVLSYVAAWWENDPPLLEQWQSRRMIRRPCVAPGGLNHVAILEREIAELEISSRRMTRGRGGHPFHA